MRRREFFSFASGAAVIAPQIIKQQQEVGVGALIAQITAAIKSDMPDVTSIEVSYDPEDQKVPLMILAFRV